MKTKRFYPIFIFIVLAFIISGCTPDYPSLPLDSEEDLASYRNYYNNEVLPYFYQTGVFGSFQGEDGVEITYAKFLSENEKGALVILHGLNETYTKYSEMIYNLRDSGFSIYIMEHRGHGNSGRILNGSDKEKRKVYIKDFNNYIKDVKTFYDTVVNQEVHEKHFIFAHSLGGCIATMYIEKYPSDFNAAVLSSPMLKIKTTHPTIVDEKVGYPMAASMVAIGKGKDYALDMEEPSVLVDPGDTSKFESELLTKSWKRWRVYNEFIQRNQYLLAGGPGATWGVTNNFAKLSYEATFKARSRCEAKKIKIPVLLFQSDEDWLVDSKGFEILKKNAVNSPSFEIVKFADAYHESYMERDEIRNQVINKTLDFINRF